MKKKLIMLTLGMIFVLFVIVAGQTPHSKASPTPSPTPTPKPLPVSDETEKVVVVDLNDLEAKVKELHAEGFHVVSANVVFPEGSSKAVIFLGESDLNTPNYSAPCEGGDCE